MVSNAFLGGGRSSRFIGKTLRPENLDNPDRFAIPGSKGREDTKPYTRGASVTHGCAMHRRLVGSGLQHVEKPRSSRELPHFLLSP